MQTKQILAIVAVVAMLGAAFVGIGYAYTASVDNSNNDAGVEYWKLSSKDGSAAPAYSENFTSGITYDTTTSNGVLYTYTPAGTISVAGVAANMLGYVDLAAVDQDNQTPDKNTENGYKMTIVYDGTAATQFTYVASIISVAGTTITPTEDQYAVFNTTSKTAVLFYKGDMDSIKVGIFAAAIDPTSAIPADVLENVKFTFTIDSKPVAASEELKSIAVAVAPTTTKFYAEATPEATPAGMKVAKFFADGSSAIVDSGFTVPTTALTTSDVKLTATLGGKTADVAISVSDEALIFAPAVRTVNLSTSSLTAAAALAAINELTLPVTYFNGASEADRMILAAELFDKDGADALTNDDLTGLTAGNTYDAIVKLKAHGDSTVNVTITLNIITA